jgi:predicted dehydrogenase
MSATQDTKKIGIAVCGAGNWGKNLVRNFAQQPTAQLRHVCDRHEAVRTQMSRLYPQAAVNDDLPVALGDPQVDAVVIAVDAPRHFEVAKACLEAGKHVFVEKPLALNAADCDSLVGLAQSANKKLMVGHLLEYHPAVEYMKQMIVDGAIDPLYLYCQRVNLGIVRTTENAWWSLAPHDISIACYLLDAEPISVAATGQSYLQAGIEDVVFASLKFANGRMAHVHVSWLDPHKERKMTLVGSKKMVAFDDMQAGEKIRIYDKGADLKNGVANFSEAISLRTGDITIPKIRGGEPLAIECRHFLDAIANNSTPRSDGVDGLRVVKVLEAGSASLAQGGAPVEIEPSAATAS